MKKLLFAIFTIATLSIAFSSCKKYEEGPTISLASKKSRLCGDWKLEQYLYNGTDQTALIAAVVGSNFVWGIEKDGTYTQAGNFSDAGTWKLGEDKDDVTFTSNATGATADTYRILKLKIKALWFKQTQANGDVAEFHLSQ